MIATVTGIIKSATGETLQTLVTFDTISAPSLGSGYVVSATAKKLSTAPDGTFSVTLESGDYWASWVNGSTQSRVRCSVPSGGGTYQFESIITSAVVYTETVVPAYALRAPGNGSYRIKDGQHIQIWNSTTGQFHTLLCVGPANALQIAFGPGEA